jgi:Arm DNA-binding domain
MARQIERLSSAKVKHAKAGFHPDSDGLYLQVTVGENGHLNRAWLFRYVFDGRERRMGLGPLRTIGLGEARDAAAECRKLLLTAKEPNRGTNADRAERRAPASTSMTLERRALAYIAAHEKSYFNEQKGTRCLITADTFRRLAIDRQVIPAA